LGWPGVEPGCSFEQRILSPSCLPIPPPSHGKRRRDPLLLVVFDDLFVADLRDARILAGAAPGATLA
jgi:hypothetical protein